MRIWFIHFIQSRTAVWKFFALDCYMFLWLHLFYLLCSSCPHYFSCAVQFTCFRNKSCWKWHWSLCLSLKGNKFQTVEPWWANERWLYDLYFAFRILKMYYLMMSAFFSRSAHNVIRHAVKVSQRVNVPKRIDFFVVFCYKQVAKGSDMIGSWHSENNLSCIILNLLKFPHETREEEIKILNYWVFCKA